MPERIVVVGHAAATCLGRDLDATWDGLIAGRSGLRRHEALDPDRYLQDIAGLVDDLGTAEPEATAKLGARAVHLACHAARSAWADAGLDRVAIDPQRAAVAVGTGLGGQDALEAERARAARKGGREVSPFLIPNLIPNQPAGQVAQQLGLLGPSVAPANACASGGHAIALAALWLRVGEADLALCGGTESTLTPTIVNGFVAMKALFARGAGDRAADDPCQAARPFSVDRAGFVMAEGAGMLVLATESAARRLGLKVQAVLAGWATNSDGHHMVIPHRPGIARCLATALERAGVRPEGVDYYNAHGTGTRVNDLVETEAVREVFGPHADRLPVSSIKGALGHALGAAAAIEAAVCVRALRAQVIPPTLHHVADPELTLDYVPNHARPARLETVLSAAFGFGGTNNALVFRRADHA